MDKVTSLMTQSSRIFFLFVVTCCAGNLDVQRRYIMSTAGTEVRERIQFSGKMGLMQHIKNLVHLSPIEVECGFSVVSGYLQYNTERRLLGIFSAALKILDQCIRSAHCSCPDSDAV